MKKTTGEGEAVVPATSLRASPLPPMGTAALLSPEGSRRPRPPGKRDTMRRPPGRGRRGAGRRATLSSIARFMPFYTRIAEF